MRHCILFCLLFFLCFGCSNNETGYKRDVGHNMTDEELTALQKEVEEHLFGSARNRWGPVSWRRIFEEFDLSTEVARKRYNAELDQITREEFIRYSTEAGFSGGSLSTFAHILHCESDFKPHAVGIENPNAISIAQIMHTVHRDDITRVVGSVNNLAEPQHAIRFAAFLAHRRIEQGEPMFQDWRADINTIQCVRRADTKEAMREFLGDKFMPAVM